MRARSEIWIEILAGVALGEWNDHIIDFISQPGYSEAWFNDKDKVAPLIAVPLRKFWMEDLTEAFRAESKFALKYTLNHDEHLHPRTRENGSLADAVLASAQHLEYKPKDSYLLCLWMWKALFPNEDWHNWTIHENSAFF